MRVGGHQGKNTAWIIDVMNEALRLAADQPSVFPA